MATNNRSGAREGSSGRKRRNNNPEGRNQYSGMMGTARENPLATAAAVGGAVAAGLFLWSRRNEISDQISNVADQISEWRDRMASDGDFDPEDIGSEAGSGSQRRDRRTQVEIAEEALTLKETGEPA